MLANAQKLVPTNDYKSTYRLVHGLVSHLRDNDNEIQISQIMHSEYLVAFGHVWSGKFNYNW